jgi:hypothetical protein
VQIIQIADLHIAPNSDMKSLKLKISKLYDALVENLNKNECTLFCVLGDVVDKGNAALYKNAIELFIYIKEKFVDYDPKFEFTPGNHDLCDCPISTIQQICKKQKCKTDKFNDFIKSFDNDYDSTDSLLYKEYDDIGIILANSVFHGNRKYGLIDIEKLNNINLKKPSILVTHHAFFSVNDNDSSAIRNAYKILKAIGNKNIVGVLHGHTHGYMNITIGEKCQVVGVGPFFKPIEGINNQANLVIVNKSGIHNVFNYFYREDTDQYDCKDVFVKKSFFYKGSDIETIYRNIVLDAQKYGILPNMNLNLHMQLDNFNAQIEQIFPDQIPVGKLWQETSDVPESLYYNHGQYMKSKDTTAMDFVIEELNSKATSSRAIIPLINFNNVIKSGDSFLPSFDVVQFGFCNDEKLCLYITLYLRALEVNHFLKINLCEIYLMCKKIKDKIRSVKTVDVTILAFRAQYKEKFGCFKKAEIDKKTKAEITISLKDNKDLKSIIKWLVEKKDFSETVVESKGIQNLCNALHSIDKKNKIKPNILKFGDSLLDKMKELEKERKKTSNYKSINTIENELNKLFDKIVNLLRKGEIYERRKKL